MYLSTGGFHSTIPATWRDAPLQVARNFEQHANKEKVPNAFDKCEQLDLPEWHRVLPADASDLWREDFLEPAPKASNAFAAGMVHKHSARKLRQVKCANIK